eukprot:COSAG01_NODE_6417_length_3677_cov_7.108720_6_plen_83_part_00
MPRREQFWERLEQIGDPGAAHTASQLCRGRRYYLANGSRAVRIDGESVHIENRQLGRQVHMPDDMISPARPSGAALSLTTRS